MKKIYTLLCAVSVSLLIVSCQKEVEMSIDSSTGASTTGGTSTAGSTDISGTWKFVNIQAQTTAINEIIAGNDISKTVTTSNYTTINNGGTVTFASGTLTATGLTYEMNTIAKVSLYQNGAFVDSFSQAVTAVIPPYNATYGYKMIGADSIYFPAGSFSMGGSTQATQPGGSKIKIEQNKLYMIQSATQTTRTTDQGQTIASTATVSATTTFQRQ